MSFYLFLKLDCKAYLKNSLFVLGELGGNDYNANLFGGRTPEQTSSYVPQIVQAISDGAEVELLFFFFLEYYKIWEITW